MGKKVFKSRRTPEYMVMTKWQPEQIDGISLKFRDLHVTLSIMRDYTDGFVKAIEAEQTRHEHYLDLQSPLPDSARQLQDLVRIVLSAHLSTYETVLYYLQESMGKTGNKWLRALRERDELLAAFDRLRNRDIHHEPMHTLIGARFRITSSAPPFSDLESKEVHIHQALLHEGVGFYPPPVAATEQFAKHPGLVEFLTYESVLQLSHRIIHRLAELLNDAERLGHWTGVGKPFACLICAAPHVGDRAATASNVGGQEAAVNEDELHAEPLDEELYALLKETCKSYQSFERALVRSLAAQKDKRKNLEDRQHITRNWLLYLFLLGYDVGFVSLAIIREGLDRQLLTMKRQAFEYSIKAHYLMRYPEKAEQQYSALPLKMQNLLERLSAQDSRFGAHEVRKTLEEALQKLPPDAGPRYGEVSVFDMVKDLYPDIHASVYINNYMLPSAIIHGSQVGRLDALKNLPSGKVWMSHFSLNSTRTQNVHVITGSLVRILLITGDRFNLVGGHWVDLVEQLNRIGERLHPGSGILDLPIDGAKLYQAATYKKARCEGRAVKPIDSTAELELNELPSKSAPGEEYSS
jgi:hypothetical protein